MKNSNSTDYEKFSGSPPPSAPYGGVPTTGIPVSSDGNYYNDQAVAGAPHVRHNNHESWTTGLCDCFSDVPNCCVTFWCPCITFGRIAEIVDRGSSSCGTTGALYTLIACVTGCSCIYSCFYRSKMRDQYQLKETPCNDCLVHCFCEYCALCQEYRELQNRGFDMSIGWHGNAERRHRGVEMAPPVETGMSR